MSRKGSFLYRAGMWFGRKFIAFVFTAMLVLVAGFFTSTNCGAITLALVGLYTAYATGHAATDIMTRRPAVPQVPVTVPPQVKKKDGDDDVD